MKPTESQIGLIFRWFNWELPTPVAQDATKWLEKNATRKQVSAEIARLKDLRDANKLNKESCFDSELWKEYYGQRAK